MADVKAQQVVAIDDLRKLANGLRSLLVAIDATYNSHLSDRKPWRTPSTAATDAGRVGAPIEDMLGLVNIRVAAALDNGDALVKMAEGAVAGAPTPTYPASTVARSAIEYVAVAHWLEAGTDAVDRAARTLSLERLSVVNQQRLGADLSEALAEVEKDAATLGFELVGRGSRRGYSEPIATRTSMVRAVLTDDDTYAVLSAASHGDTWALVKIGYTDAGEETRSSGWGTSLVKKPPVIWLYNALLRTMQAIARCAWVDIRYRGWDAVALEKDLEAAFNLASLKPEARPWP